jgi:3-hydroxyisobutyrate dehydrogenase-like beta-hydroxyacid dehydrogenase
MTVEETPVTVLGLGAMGRALAAALLGNGHKTTVWNRTAGRAEGLDATVARSAGEAVEASPLVVVCLLNHDTVHQVLDPVGDSLAGRTVVNLTNGTPAQAREMASWVGERGGRFLDGGIMAVPPMIGTPAGLILYSGVRQAFEEHEPALAHLATARYLGEDPGDAARYDLALLSAMYGMFGGFFHGAALVDSAKASLPTFAELVAPWINAMTASLPRMAESLASGDHAASFSSVQMQATGYANLIDASRDQGVSTLLVEPMGSLLDRGVAAGLGTGGLSALIELLYART